MREVAIVFDEYNNEIFFGETVGECHNYCDTHNITGEHGEYIGIGVFMKTQDILNSKIMRAYKILERIDFIMDMKLNGYSVYEMQRSAISILNDYFNGFKKYLVDSSYSYDFLFYKLQELSVLLDSFYAVHLLSDDELSFYSDWRHSYYRTLESLS